MGPVVMMQLGEFQFGIATAAYQDLSRTTEYRWPSQERYGQAAALQFTGPGSDTQTLKGVIYPEWRGGTGQLDRMRQMAAAGQPLTLVSGGGAIMGRWVIERIEEGQTIFASAGVPRRQEFTMNLRWFGDAVAVMPLPQELTAAAGAADEIGAAAGDVSTLSEAVSSVSSMAQSVSEAATEAVTTLTGKLNEIREEVAPVIAAGQSAIGAVARSLDVVRDLKNTADATVRQVQTVTSIFGAASGARTLLDKATALSSSAASATNVLNNVLSSASGAGARVSSVLSSAKSAASGVEGLVRKTAKASSDLYDDLTA